MVIDGSHTHTHAHARPRATTQHALSELNDYMAMASDSSIIGSGVDIHGLFAHLARFLRQEHDPGIMLLAARTLFHVMVG